MRKGFKEFFAQKDRKRAIGITDVAITKVPKTHIFGFNNEQNLYIQNLHKELLCQVQKAMKYILKKASKYGIEYKKGRNRL